MNEILKKKRLEKNMSLEDVGKLVGVGKSTVRKWENGMIENMGRDKIVALSKALDISPIDILGMSEKDLPKSSIETIYNQLEKPRQEKVYNFAEQQLEEQNRGNVVCFPKKEKLPTIKNSASAANPTELVYGDTVVEEEEFERVPSSADFAVPIIGDSMEPVIRNGQFVFVKEQPDVEDGEIAIVEIDGDGVTCKEVYKDYESQTIILRSINELYQDRVVSPEQIRIIGKVVF
ncbi:XRE family transcriptional regulator [Enterococcus faecium]|uniref:XRE family transcriptional regulator n=1 Tax=Enterococcus faecium TaxID=1352 RepID=UPI001896ACD1|nr:XRE family transcriptional regulator [Enterococcus faecium]